MPKNKLFFAIYIIFIVVLSITNNFWLFLISFAASLFIGSSRRFVLLKRAFAGVAFFTGFTLLGSMAGALFLGVPVEFGKIAVLFGRSFSIAFLTLSIVDRVGILKLLDFSPSMSLFFAMIFAKIEMLSKEIREFKEAAQSRGMQVTFKDAISLLSIVITALFIKSMEGFGASHEAMRSRGYGA